MEIKINGDLEKIASISVKDYLLKRGLDLKSLIIEYNFEILKKENWEKVYLKDGDNLEILSFVGGG